MHQIPGAPVPHGPHHHYRVSPQPHTVQHHHQEETHHHTPKDTFTQGHHHSHHSASPPQIRHPHQHHGSQHTGPGARHHVHGLMPTPQGGSVVANAKIVAEVARQKGVDPATAVASMLAESGGDARKLGDYNKHHQATSFGLFQLHKGGELGSLSPQQAFNPHTNAEVALSEFAARKHQFRDPGQLAAAAQRPKHPEAYAHRVDQLLPSARRLLREFES